MDLHGVPCTRGGVADTGGHLSPIVLRAQPQRCRPTRLWCVEEHHGFLVGAILCHARSQRTLVRQRAPSLNCEYPPLLDKEAVEISAKKSRASQAFEPPFKLGKLKTPTLEQRAARDQIVELFTQGCQKVTLKGVTGCGKTFVSAMVIESLQPRAVLMVTNNKVLVRQSAKCFNADFERGEACAFTSETSAYSASVWRIRDGTLKVQRGRRRIDEDVQRDRHHALEMLRNNTTGGAGVIISSSVSALYSLPRSLIYSSADSCLNQEEIDHIVDHLESEIEQNSYKTDGLTAPSGEILRKKTKADIELLKGGGHCPDLFDCYADLLPTRLQQTLLHRMNEEHGKEWLLVVDECHNTIPDMKRPATAHRTIVSKRVDAGFCRPHLLESLDDPGQVPLSWEGVQNLMPSRVLFMSATPPTAQDMGEIVSLTTRPTHIQDPEIHLQLVEPSTRARRCWESKHDLWKLIHTIRDILHNCDPEHQALVATISCVHADVIHSFLCADFECGVVHGFVPAEQKTKVLNMLKDGELDTVVGCKTIIEGLDMPGVATVIVCDADSGGILRGGATLHQLVGRASRHAAGQAFFLVSDENGHDAVKQCMEEHAGRRIDQEIFNKKNGYVPTSIDWAPRDLRKQKKQMKQQAKSPEATGTGEANLLRYSFFHCIRILEAFVQSCWDTRYDEDEVKATKPTSDDRIFDDGGERRNEFFYSIEDGQGEKRLGQLILMVTIPLIGKERSYHLLERFGTIEDMLQRDETEWRTVVQIGKVLSSKFAESNIKKRLQNTRIKFQLLLSNTDFIGQVKDHMATLPRAEWKKEVGAALREPDEFVKEMIFRLLEYIVASSIGSH